MWMTKQSSKCHVDDQVVIQLSCGHLGDHPLAMCKIMWLLAWQCGQPGGHPHLFFWPLTTLCTSLNVLTASM